MAQAMSGAGPSHIVACCCGRSQLVFGKVSSSRSRQRNNVAMLGAIQGKLTLRPNLATAREQPTAQQCYPHTVQGRRPGGATAAAVCWGQVKVSRRVRLIGGCGIMGTHPSLPARSIPWGRLDFAAAVARSRRSASNLWHLATQPLIGQAALAAAASFTRPASIRGPQPTTAGPRRPGFASRTWAPPINIRPAVLAQRRLGGRAYRGPAASCKIEGQTRYGGKSNTTHRGLMVIDPGANNSAIGNCDHCPKHSQSTPKANQVSMKVQSFTHSAHIR
jgi:hypothetical protein